MSFEEHTQPHKLERYSFLWSEARLVIAAVALFLGGVPVLRAILPGYSFYGLVGAILTVTWIITGVASAYLLYRFFQAKQTVFGGSDKKDLIAFFISVISGINLGFVGLTGNNIGMSIVYNKFVFIIVGILYLLSAWHLYMQWQKHEEKVF